MKLFGKKNKQKDKPKEKPETSATPKVEQKKVVVPPVKVLEEKNIEEKSKKEVQPPTKPMVVITSRTYIACPECKTDTKGMLQDCKSCNNTRKQLKEWTEEVT